MSVIYYSEWREKVDSDTNNDLSMLDAQSFRIIATFAVRTEDEFEGIHSCSVCSVSNGMDIDLKAGVEPLDNLAITLQKIDI